LIHCREPVWHFFSIHGVARVSSEGRTLKGVLRQSQEQDFRKQIDGCKSKEKELTMSTSDLNKLVSVAGRILLSFLFLFSQTASQQWIFNITTET
jgi:hypothetical protein